VISPCRATISSEAHFSDMAGWHFSTDLTRLVGAVRVTYLLRMAEITSGSSFEPNNPTEQKLGYV